jgi:NAD(P)-dependent dehydrogenase (short-subunit alcohol dehydrogenase family)
MSTSPVVLILGSGSNVGKHVAQAFAAKGYKVALASRSLKGEDSTADRVHISSDFADPESVIRTFSKVKELLGVPSVVVYNGNTVVEKVDPHTDILEAAAATLNDGKHPLALPWTDFSRGLAINTTSAYVAAQQAALGFAQLPHSASKTFIYTGNILNTKTIPVFLDLGVGKTATAYIIESASICYSDRGFK